MERWDFIKKSNKIYYFNFCGVCAPSLYSPTQPDDPALERKKNVILQKYKNYLFIFMFFTTESFKNAGENLIFLRLTAMCSAFNMRQPQQQISPSWTKSTNDRWFNLNYLIQTKQKKQEN